MTINTLVMPSSVSTIHQTLYKHLRCVCQKCVKWICRADYEFNQRNTSATYVNTHNTHQQKTDYRDNRVKITNYRNEKMKGFSRLKMKGFSRLKIKGFSRVKMKGFIRVKMEGFSRVKNGGVY